MDVGHRVLGGAGWTRLGHRGALADTVVALHEERAEMSQRDLVTVSGQDGDGQPVGRNRAGERDLSRHRRPNRSTGA